ncbi:MAG: DUF3641 domain-containing protein [Deferribacteres bacterium]|nr:DUF3641 domain-containing protein [Deferribacteres bacterium]
MNVFDQRVKETGHYPLTAERITILTLNVGYKCNMQCPRCYADLLADRTEEMSLGTAEKILEILGKNREITTVYILGGAPELNPHIKYFIKAAADMGREVMLNTNLSAYSEPGMEDLPSFLAANRVKLLSYLSCYTEPCYTVTEDGYTEEGLDRQRGVGTYGKIISAIKKLNEAGYGREDGSLILDIVFHPASPLEDPCLETLETGYKGRLKKMHNVTFNHLLAMNTFPTGLLKKTMSGDEVEKYTNALAEKFNPCLVKDLMCRHSISVAHDEKLYHCDYWQLLGRSAEGGEPWIGTIDGFDYGVLSKREIATSPLFCFLCTAGAGCSDIEHGESKISAVCKEPEDSVREKKGGG